MELDSYMKREVRLELLRRGPSACAAFVLLATWVLWERSLAHDSVLAHILTSSVIYVCCIARVWICMLGLKPGAELSPVLKKIHDLTIIFNGVGFGLFFSWALLDHPYPGNETVEGIFILCGTVAASPITLGAAPILQAGYIATAVGMPMLVLFRLYGENHNDALRSLIALLAILVFYVAMQTRQALRLFKSGLVANFQLLQEHARLQAIIDSVPGFVICVDREGRLSAVTRGLSSHIGIRYEAGVAIEKLSDPLGQLVHRFYQSGDSTQVREIQIKYDQKPHWHLISMTRLDSAIHSMIATGASIDELYKIRQELLVQTAKVHYSAKLASLGEMAGGIAHEVNNPLMIVQGSLDEVRTLLNKPTPPNPEALSVSLQRGWKAINRVTKIIRALLLFSRQAEDDPFQITKVQGILDDTLEFCRARFKSAGIELELTTDPELTTRCRPTQLSQVVLNLLNNAYDATLNAAKKRVRVTSELVGANVKISVIDSGPGVAPAVAERMFEPFFTTKPPGSGTGLGLSISQGIMQSHEGRIYFEPSSEGATFSLELPAQPR